MVITFFLILTLVFVLARYIPGDPVRAALGWDASEEQVAAFRHEMGLDQPILTQYVNFLIDFLSQGKMGFSMKSFRDVSVDILQRFPATFELASIAIIIALVIGVPLGVISGTTKSRFSEGFARVFSITGVSMPFFVSGIILQFFLSYSLRILPIYGRFDPDIIPPTHVTGLFLVDSLLTLNPLALITSLKYILLPGLVLSFAPIAQVTRLVRASMLEEATKDYVLSARANGLPEKLVVYKYMLKRAMSATVTQIGILFGYSLGGSFIVETVFAWPGIASYGVQSILAKDINGIVGVTLIFGFTFLVINFVVDLIYGYLDPRIRFKE